MHCWNLYTLQGLVTISDLPRFEVGCMASNIPHKVITLETSNPPRMIKGNDNKSGMAKSKLIFIRRFFHHNCFWIIIYRFDRILLISVKNFIYYKWGRLYKVYNNKLYSVEWEIKFYFHINITSNHSIQN